MAAARWRYVGEDLAAAAGHETGEGFGLSADLGRGATFMMVPDSSVMDVAGKAARIEVEAAPA